MGPDHDCLPFWFSRRDDRLTDLFGNAVREILI